MLHRQSMGGSRRLYRHWRRIIPARSRTFHRGYGQLDRPVHPPSFPVERDFASCARGLRSSGRRLCLEVARGSHARNRGLLSNIRMLRVRAHDDSRPVGINIVAGVAQLRCRCLAPSPFKEGVFNRAVRDLTCDSQPVRWRGDSHSHQPRAAFVSPETRLRGHCETTSVPMRRAF